jgi:phage shock protein C
MNAFVAEQNIRRHFFTSTIFITFVKTTLIMNKRLIKGQDKKIFGVCSGLGNYFDIDPTLIRVLFVFAFLAFGSGLLLYIILAIVMPQPETGNS